MKERPILFTPDNAGKVWKGLKTQTRRVADTYGEHIHYGKKLCEWDLSSAPFRIEAKDLPLWRWKGKSAPETGEWAQYIQTNVDDYCTFPILCPFGAPGDLLWVREAWRTWEDPKTLIDGILYKADGSFRPIENTKEAADKWVVAHDNGRHGDKWRHARFMFRWCSRTLLEITDVRVERLQSISEEDAVAEGVTATPYSKQDIEDIQISDCAPEIKELATILGPGQFTAKANFMMLWDSINLKTHPWSSDPWVFAISFRRINNA